MKGAGHLHSALTLQLCFALSLTALLLVEGGLEHGVRLSQLLLPAWQACWFVQATWLDACQRGDAVMKLLRGEATVSKPCW